MNDIISVSNLFIIAERTSIVKEGQALFRLSVCKVIKSVNDINQQAKKIKKTLGNKIILFWVILLFIRNDQPSQAGNKV